MSAIKGILLCGGNGTRLYPLTQVVPKALQTVYDKPMIYYSLSTLMLAGITDILIISSKRHLHMFEELLGNGRQFGIKLTYAEQAKPKGIAEALIIAEEFTEGKRFALMLGDNFFYADNLVERMTVAQNLLFEYDASIFAYPVSNPNDYGVIDDAYSRIVEKPEKAPSNLAVPGLYFFRNNAIRIAKKIRPSKRGELEITDVINELTYLHGFTYTRLSRGVAWFDMGTPKTLHDVSNFVEAVEARTGLKIGCPEEIAWRNGYINERRMEGILGEMPTGEYRAYLLRILYDGNQETTTVDNGGKRVLDSLTSATCRRESY